MTSVQVKSEREIEQRLVHALRGRGGQLTRSDAVALTGLPVQEVEQGLSSMLASYHSHLAATASGELLYAFDPALRRRDAEPLSVRLARLGAWLWQLFVVLFKIAIVVVLVTYFVIFITLLLGLFFAKLSTDRDRDRGPSHDGHGGGLPLWLLWWMLPGDRGPAPSYPARRGYAPARRPRRKAYQQVFSFVFGPPRQLRDPAAADREVLAYLRAHAGRLTAAELVALRGLDLARAEDEATRLMCDYNGEPEVTEDGVVLYVFRELRVTAGSEPAGHYRYAWEHLEERPPLTENSGGANVVIGLLNAFNLLAPLAFVPSAMQELGLVSATAELWLRAVPVSFSAAFFAVPLGRALARALREPARRRRNRRRLLLREVFRPAGEPAELSAAQLRPVQTAELAQALAAQDAKEQAALQREAEALLVPLGADVLLESPALGKLVFPRLQAELSAVARERARAPLAEAQAGEVIFDSGAALPGETK